MSILDNHQEIKKLSDQIKVKPPEELWSKVQSKLISEKRYKKALFFGRIKTWMTVAASVTVIITCFSLIYLESNNPQFLYKSNSVYLENLDEQTDYFYSIENARSNNQLKKNNSNISSDIDLKSLKGTSLLPIVFRDYPI